MAKYNSIVRIQGDASGLNFYTKDGKTYVRNQTTLSRNRILNDPAFKRTRENMQEFGASSSIAATVRRGMGRRILQTMGDTGMTARFAALFRRVLSKGTGRRGQRDLNLSAHAGLLEGFEFHQLDKFTDISGAPYITTVNAGKNQVTLDFPIFDPEQENAIPVGATHFRYVLSIASCSPHQWDTSLQRYEPTLPAEHGLGDTKFSAFLPTDAPLAAPISVVANLPGSPALSTGVSLIICLGIQYFQEVNGDQYLLATGNAMKIISIA